MKLINLIFIFFPLCLSCQTQHNFSNDIEQTAFRDIVAQLVTKERTMASLSKTGPIRIIEKKNLNLSISINQHISFDYALPGNDESSPLVILHHGNKFIKEAHWNQAKHLASWGFHAITVQSKNEYNWLNNGRRLHMLVSALQRNPSMLSSNIDSDKIILVGHSFGGSAITLAGSLNKKITGLILLDPAVVNDRILNAQKQVRSNSVLLGADPEYFRSRKRSTFYKNMKNLIYELSVKGSTHNAAQSPTITEYLWGYDPTTKELNIKAFTHLITASSFALTRPITLNNIYRNLLVDMRKKLILKSLKIKGGFSGTKNTFEPVNDNIDF